VLKNVGEALVFEGGGRKRKNIKMFVLHDKVIIEFVTTAADASPNGSTET
jgi:hypothetical protein